MSSNWEDVKARKEIRRLALELDPIIWVSYTYEQDETLSQLVDREGWEGAMEFPEVRRFLDRLGAVVAEQTKYTADLVAKAVEYQTENTMRTNSRIEKALAPLMSAQASMTRLELLEAIIAGRAALTGEEGK